MIKKNCSYTFFNCDIPCSYSQECDTWVEATHVVVYVKNRVSHQALENMTTEEIFTGNKINIIHIRIFGCPVYFHVPKDKRKKLEATGRKGVFVGYCENYKAYRLYIVGQRKVEIGRDIKFDEDATLGKERYVP